MQSMLRRATNLRRLSVPFLHKRASSTIKHFQDGDHILLNIKTETSTPIFAKLVKDKPINTRWGGIAYADLLDAEPRAILSTSIGNEVRVFAPTLDEYCRFTPRHVTPVYPADANLIVSLLDLHVGSSPADEKEPPLQILEAGTGHGALTLHLARAIHGANPTLPPIARDELNQLHQWRAHQEVCGHKTKVAYLHGNEAEEPRSPSPLEKFQRSCGAIVHTVELKASHSERARKVLWGFRRGLYVGDVEFYVGDVDEWISTHLGQRKALLGLDAETPFLSHIILDAPGSHQLVAQAARALLTDGSLILFCPNISQIMAAVKIVRSMRLPLFLDRVLETGPALTGGREWDIRAVKPRVLVKAEAERKRRLEAEESSADSLPSVASADSGAQADEPVVNGAEDLEAEKDDEGWEMICRPKVGERVIGGGFVALWKKMRPRE